MTSARLPKTLMLNHSVCSCGSPALFFQRSVLAMVKVAMAVPPGGLCPGIRSAESSAWGLSPVS